MIERIPKKSLDEQCDNMRVRGKLPSFATKLEQAVQMLIVVAASFPGMPILVVCDSWFGNYGLFGSARDAIGISIHMLSRLRRNIALYDIAPPKDAKARGRPRKYGDRLGSVAEVAASLWDKAETISLFLYGKNRQLNVASKVVTLKTLRCPVRVVFVYRKTQWVAIFTTDLTLSTQQIIEFYGARWKIESGFKEIKQEIGSSKSQTRNAVSVSNHLNFCMMAVAVSWLYAIRLENAPERRHIVRGRSSFALSDIRHIIAKAAMDENFSALCNNHRKPRNYSPVAMLLRMVA